MSKSRLAYFGTTGKASGHKFISLRGEFPDTERDFIARQIDSPGIHFMLNSEGRKRTLFNIGRYTVYAIPMSRYDKRPDCVTALITDYEEMTQEDFEREIENDDFIKEMFTI
jgi:hypothetical protein